MLCLKRMYTRFIRLGRSYSEERRLPENNKLTFKEWAQLAVTFGLGAFALVHSMRTSDAATNRADSLNALVTNQSNVTNAALAAQSNAANLRIDTLREVLAAQSNATNEVLAAQSNATNRRIIALNERMDATMQRIDNAITSLLEEKHRRN